MSHANGNNRRTEETWRVIADAVNALPFHIRRLAASCEFVVEEDLGDSLGTCKETETQDGERSFVIELSEDQSSQSLVETLLHELGHACRLHCTRFYVDDETAEYEAENMKERWLPYVRRSLEWNRRRAQPRSWRALT